MEAFRAQWIFGNRVRVIVGLRAGTAAAMCRGTGERSVGRNARTLVRMRDPVRDGGRTLPRWPDVIALDMRLHAHDTFRNTHFADVVRSPA
ncbi:MAG TPA: hypothetical protein VL359_16845, partial [bacterium]|nr:hypothetical protein [bacterium]